MRSVIATQSSLITGPTREPVDIDEVKKVLKFAPTSEDTLLDLWVSSARQEFETATGYQLLTATWELWLDAFPDTSTIELPHPPLRSVVSVVYDDSAGDEQTVDAATYRVIAPQGPTAARGSVSLALGASWPTAGTQAKAVRIRYTAGFGNAPADVPEVIKGALYNLVALSHRFRGADEEKYSRSAQAVCRRWTGLDTPRLAPPMTTVVSTTE